MNFEYKIKSKIWLYPGFAGWHFINVDKATTKKIRQLVTGATRGFGSVRVLATIGKTDWKTSIFPDNKSGTYLLAIKAEVRKKENLKMGDTVNFRIKLVDF